MKKINQINKKERDIELAFVALLIIYIYVCSYFFDRLREGCPVFEKVLFHLSEELHRFEERTHTHTHSTTKIQQLKCDQTDRQPSVFSVIA